MIIKITRLIIKDSKVVSKKPILFNTDRVITIEPNDYYGGGCYIRHVSAMVDSFYCTETLEEIEELIKNAK